jgi:hypothetical protein
LSEDCRENRWEYIWFFSGREQTIEGYTAGVGIVIHNKLIKHIVDIEPRGDRVMYIILKGTMEITMVNVHFLRPPGLQRNRKKYTK